MDRMPSIRRYSARGERQTFAAHTTNRFRPRFSSRTTLPSVPGNPNRPSGDTMHGATGPRTGRTTRGGLA
jgi:hypothetical protein